MARKLSQQILLGGALAEHPTETNVTPHLQVQEGRKISPLARGGALAGGPVGAINKSLEEVFSRHDNSDELRSQIANGQAVIELDPSSIDGSFITDRMAENEVEFRSLVEAIRARGQQVPILLRPHPDQAGRYQVAYGHRRLRVVAELVIKVRAVIKNLSDEELVIAQGQENNARLDLSCIEQATFAAQLEERGFSRATILEALSIDKAALSKLISIATKIPSEVIGAIGRAPAIGRARWLELVEYCQKSANIAKAKEIIAKADFANLSSDDRFLRILNRLSQKPEAVSGAQTTFWNDGQGRRVVQIKKDRRTFTLQIDRTVAPEFGDYILRKLDDLYQSFEAEQSQGQGT
jgi:ParB family transcriptional regulator, chromosome partitioning protein